MLNTLLFIAFVGWILQWDHDARSTVRRADTDPAPGDDRDKIRDLVQELQPRTSQRRGGIRRGLRRARRSEPGVFVKS